jgi:hypothetical protein
MMKFLFARSEGELRATIRTNQRLIDERHPLTSKSMWMPTSIGRPNREGAAARSDGRGYRRAEYQLDLAPVIS